MATIPAAEGLTLRIPALPLGWVLVAFAGALASPFWLLLLTPLLLGVPHLLGDLRCLVLARPGGIPRSALTCILAPLAAMTALRVVGLVSGASWPRLEIGLGVLAIACGVLGVIRGRAHRLLGGLALGGSACLLLVDPAATNLVLAHAHNLVAWVFFAVWARDRGEARGMLALAALGVLGLCCATPFVLQGGAVDGLTWQGLEASLAPGLPEALARGVVTVYAFTQALHYALWIVMIPRARGLLPFAGQRGSSRGVAWLALAIAVLVPAFALLDAAGTRAHYLSLATFHAWLELAVGGWLLARRWVPCRPS